MPWQIDRRILSFVRTGTLTSENDSMHSPVRAMLGIGCVVALVAAVTVASVWKPDLSVDSLKPRWAKPPSQFVTLDGMQVHIRDEGQRDAPTPIVF